MRRQISSTVEEGVRQPPNDVVRSYWRSLIRRCDETTPTSLEHPRTAAQPVDASQAQPAREPISNISAIRCVSTGHMQHAPTQQHVPVTWVPGPHYGLASVNCALFQAESVSTITVNKY